MAHPLSLFNHLTGGGLREFVKMIGMPGMGDGDGDGDGDGMGGGGYGDEAGGAVVKSELMEGVDYHLIDANLRLTLDPYWSRYHWNMDVKVLILFLNYDKSQWLSKVEHVNAGFSRTRKDSIQAGVIYFPVDKFGRIMYPVFSWSQGTDKTLLGHTFGVHASCTRFTVDPQASQVRSFSSFLTPTFSQLRSFNTSHHRRRYTPYDILADLPLPSHVGPAIGYGLVAQAATRLLHNKYRRIKIFKRGASELIILSAIVGAGMLDAAGHVKY